MNNKKTKNNFSTLSESELLKVIGGDIFKLV
ncbi:TPA: ComC/BlpC family leader-containing pheromone/bacteriocin, partial [Streptococcus pyogenes]